MKIQMKIHLFNVLGLLRQWLGKKIEIDEQDLHSEEGKRRLTEKLMEALAQIKPILSRGLVGKFVRNLIKKIENYKHE